MGVADPNQCGIQQHDHGGQHLFPSEPRFGELRLQLLAQFGQGFAERLQACVFVSVAHFTPACVVAVLLASTRVAAGGLQMAARVGADPYIGIGGRYGQGVQALDVFGIGDALALGIKVLEFATQLFTANVWLRVINIMQVVGQVGGQRRIGHGAGSLAISQAGMSD